jgi:tetratricopeptide (TPR) repeat protein
LLSFAGSGYAAAGDWGAAERKFRRALGVNPAFSPAHLNLAECLLRRSAEGEAAREIALAEAFNVGNVFGLAGAVAEFRQRVTGAKAAGPLDAAAITYGTIEALTEEDRRLAAVLEGDSKNAVRGEERAKTLHSLAVHFADTGRPELAQEHFHRALAALREADPKARHEMARQVLLAMSEVCRRAGFGEAEEYRQMSVSLSGATGGAELP